MIQSTSVYYWLSVIVATEHYQQIANHGSLLVVVELYYLLTREFIKRHLYHRYSTLYYLFACSDDGAGLLAAQHYSSNFRSIGQIVDTSLYHFDTSQSQALIQLLLQLLVYLISTRTQCGFASLSVLIVVSILTSHLAQTKFSSAFISPLVSLPTALGFEAMVCVSTSNRAL